MLNILHVKESNPFFLVEVDILKHLFDNLPLFFQVGIFPIMYVDLFKYPSMTLGSFYTTRYIVIPFNFDINDGPAQPCQE